MKEKFKNICIVYDADILFALKQMDDVDHKLLIVLKEGKVFGLISVGDIQRAMIAKVPLTEPIYTVLRKDVSFLRQGEDISLEKEKMKKNRNEFMPIVSENNELLDVIFWKDLFPEQKSRLIKKLGIPVVIMAGGKGSRLEPITNVLPKPLIPVGKKTIVEEIMDRFVDAGCCNFHMSVNYKADMMKYYFSSLKASPYTIDYFQEAKPLGTAGSMYLIKDRINSTFFVSNCDIIIDQDLEEIYNYHIDNKNAITIVSVLKHYKIPYGIIETGKQGLLESLSEKPELTFQINSGMYILEAELLGRIPENTFFHITELIENVKEAGMNVGVFPVSEGSWRDIGTWKEFLHNQEISIF